MPAHWFCCSNNCLVQLSLATQHPLCDIFVMLAQLCVPLLALRDRISSAEVSKWRLLGARKSFPGTDSAYGTNVHGTALPWSESRLATSRVCHPSSCLALIFGAESVDWGAVWGKVVAQDSSETVSAVHMGVGLCRTPAPILRTESGELRSLVIIAEDITQYRGAIEIAQYWIILLHIRVLDIEYKTNATLDYSILN